MSYGTYLFPRDQKQGPWVLQTDQKDLIGLMQERHWDAKSPWRQCLQGTSFGFTRYFSCARNAQESVARILNKLTVQAFNFSELSDGKCWQIRITCTPDHTANPCAYSGENHKPQSTKAA
jgi:hypothetical protein